MRRNPIKKTILLTAAMAVAVAAVLWMWDGSDKRTLSLVDSKTGLPYLTVPVRVGDTFNICFLHSVNKSPIMERYAIGEDGIYLEECRFSSFGAGVATSVEEGQQLLMLDDGQMLLTGIHQFLPYLQIRVGKVTDHVLEINGRQISLTELCGQNTSVRFVLNTD